MDALAFDSVRHRFGQLTAVDGVSLTVSRGELVCLLGPSGCGKTTMLRLAAGLERLQQGRIIMAGEVVADGRVDLSPEDRQVGLVFQDFALFPHLNVADNVAFGLKGLARDKRMERVEEALRQVSMESYRNAYPHTLSGGQQQRVALARALAPKPAVVLLDEPFSGLDMRLRNEVRDQTLHILKKSGAATLMVTHDPEEAMFMSDRIALMNQGQLVQTDKPVDLYYSPASVFAASFLNDTNQLTGVVRDGGVETALGKLEADGLADGETARILIRPEAIKLIPPGAHAGSGRSPARVVTSKLLGRSSLIHLSVINDGKEALHLHARVPGRFLPAEGETFSLDLDFHQTFVFSDSDSI
ncbi:ABC transporter ATP-binding protein [Fodinicurvata halophila]|uniref:ABC transporter ATP-binding protein n=1 Tax=Fodinicurvata halophila TaxID=1419723 RepID=A0ABV8UKM9_9PROT